MFNKKRIPSKYSSVRNGHSLFLDVGPKASYFANRYAGGDVSKLSNKKKAIFYKLVSFPNMSTEDYAEQKNIIRSLKTPSKHNKK